MTDLSTIQGMQIPNWSKDELKKKLSKKDLWEFLIGMYGDEIMSRENKFRVWDQNSKKWPKEDYVLFPDGKPGWGYWEYGTFKTDSYYQDEKGLVVEQFTGLKDRNGKEIYEGDIVQYDHDKDMKSKIVYKFGCFYAVNTLGSEFMSDVLLGSLIMSNKIEVIGNVHTNPELLEAEE